MFFLHWFKTNIQFHSQTKHSKIQSETPGILKMKNIEPQYLDASIQVVTFLVASRCRNGFAVEETLSDGHPGSVMCSKESHIYHPLFVGSHHFGRPKGKALQFGPNKNVWFTL